MSMIVKCILAAGALGTVAAAYASAVITGGMYCAAVDINIDTIAAFTAADAGTILASLGNDFAAKDMDSG